MTHGVHPADEIEAFARLAEAGHGPEAIAGRFGVTGACGAAAQAHAVWPRLIDALKTDDIDLDRLGALAFTDDHTLQERAFFDTPGWQRTPEQLRAKVTQAHVAETDKLVRFVALCAGRQLKDAVGAAVARWMGWSIGRKTSDTTGIPVGLPYLTGFVLAREIEADAQLAGDRA